MSRTDTGTSSPESGTFSHKPVLFAACMDALNIRPDGIYVDGTARGGGHSAGIASRLTTGRLIAIDQDEAAVRAGLGEARRPWGTRHRGAEQLLPAGGGVRGAGN